MKVEHYEEFKQDDVKKIVKEENVAEEVQQQLSDPTVKKVTVTKGVKGRDRNLPCPCGSGVKFKKCCG